MTLEAVRRALALSFSSIWQLAMESTASGALGWSGACCSRERKLAMAPR